MNLKAFFSTAKNAAAQQNYTYSSNQHIDSYTSSSSTVALRGNMLVIVIFQGSFLNASAHPFSLGSRFIKRVMDIFLSLILGGLLLIPMLIITVAIRLSSPGPALYWSDRVGAMNHLFRMPKFRSMRTDTPEVATHLLQQADSYITPVGAFLRRTSLDELPQLWSILIGDMSFVGPRPALFNQDDLIEQRTALGVHQLKPGLTGLAQISGRDDLEIPVKVSFDARYLKEQSLFFDLYIMWQTFLQAIKREGVHH